jgi:hypothetical protein
MELDYKLIDQIPEAKGKLNYKFSWRIFSLSQIIDT